MDVSGLIQSYDSRATSSTATLSRAIMAPHYAPAIPYTGPPINTIISTHQQIQHHNPFGFGSYSGPSPNGMIPAFANNFVQQRSSLPRLMAPDGDGGPGMSFSRTTTRQGFVEEHHHSQSPPIKTEQLWSGAPSNSSPTFVPANTKTNNSSAPGSASDVNFGTEVDTLMKAIQAKSKTTPQTPSPVTQSRPVVGVSVTPPYRQAAVSQGNEYEERKFKLTQANIPEEASSHKGNKKRYECTIENCTKSFYQKTHLDIHERSHTGIKPYPCKEPNCGRSFSQLGNLKTHERRHTGERPYQCEICGKRFAQRGNVRAHKIVHDQAKPYLCRLDDCGKQFTQLGNLKSHQNKFHIATIRALTQKFASIKDGDIVHAADKELWEYFANLYKNSNKGIKGRGKDRKVGPNHASSSSSSMNISSSASRMYTTSTSNRGMGMGMGIQQQQQHHGLPQVRNQQQQGQGQGQGQYEMFDVDEQGSQSQTHSQCGSGSSVGSGTCYDDAASDGYEDVVGRGGGGGGGGGDLAFGDRIY